MSDIEDEDFEIDEEVDEDEDEAPPKKSSGGKKKSSDDDDDDDLDDEAGDAMDDEDEEDGNLIENTYYNAKGTLEDDVNEALELFETILEMEESKGQWGFKALKQMVKALLKQNRYNDFVKRYKQLLGYMNVVSRNDSEKAINKILGLVSTLSDRALLDSVYTLTLDALKTIKNDKLWFNTKIKQGKLYFDHGDYDKLRHVIRELKLYCMMPSGAAGSGGAAAAGSESPTASAAAMDVDFSAAGDAASPTAAMDNLVEDPKKLSQLLDVYVLEIQMCTEHNEHKRLKELYDRCMRIASGAVVLNPRMTGVIRECGAKMFMREKQWARAHENFFEAFKAYDEAGSPRRIACLKYLVLANMLMSSNINPFDANEAKPYKQHPEIVAMTNLIAAYQRGDIVAFEKILKTHRQGILEDTFMKDYINDLLKNIRTKVILRLVRPYTRIRLAFLARELNITEADVEALCVDLILDDELDGRIDQIHSVLELSRSGASAGGAGAGAASAEGSSAAQPAASGFSAHAGAVRNKAIIDWTRRLQDTHAAILAKV